MTIENPWKILDSRFIYENAWIRVREDAVLNPAGKDGIYTTVHFKNKALGIVPVDNEGYTWLVGQYRYPLHEYSWEIPMGGGKIGIDILESAKRELLEETGITAQTWSMVARVHTSNSVTDEEGFVYLAQNLAFGESEPEETEVLKVRKVLLSEAVEMCMRNEITDSISVIGLMKVAKLLGV
ncbi:MAG: NUDIX hydrolase [Bacteroidetes bacterium]|jgi:8-oxo-dGTP pyrophosphatase MutT (NUDIX family)|nr:MAG: NUDIX hydrolase [Bacteroidota bacterium]